MKEYYAELEKLKVIPQSAAPSPEDFYKNFERSIEEGAEHVIYISVSSKMSSTFQTSQLIAKRFKGKVKCIDSFSASGIQGLLILAVIRMLEKDYSFEKIIAKLEELRYQSIIFGGLYTLENIYKSGRFKSRILLELTKLLNITPIFQLKAPEGIIQPKFPGIISEKHMERRLVKLIVKSVDPSKTYNAIISHVENKEGAERVVERLKSKIKLHEIYMTEASPVIGTHAGKHTIIVSLLPTIEK